MTQERLFQAVTDYRLGKNQDEAAMIIYDGTSRSALAVIMKHCSRKSEHEDILQITFMNVFNHLGDLKDITKIQSWVNTIAAYTAMRYGKQLHPELYQDVTDEEGNFPDFVDERPENQPEAFIESDAQHHAINEAMDTLPQVQKDAILMLYAEQMSAKEAAERQGVSVNTVRSRAFQGLKKLEKRKDIFQKHGVEITAVPLTLLIFSSFQRDVYAAEISAESMTVLSAARNGIVNAMAGTSAKAGVEISAAKAAVGTNIKAGAIEKSAATVKAGTVIKAGAAAKGASAGLGVKIAAGAIAAAVVIGGGAVAVTHRNSQTDITTTVYESQANPDTSAVITTSSEQAKVSPHYITLYDCRLNDGNNKESYTYTYQYEFTENGKIAKLTKPSSYRHGKGISGYQITEYDDHENELIVIDLDDDEKTVTTYRNEYDGDLLIGWTAISEDGSEAVSRQEFNETGKRIFKYDGLLNRESTYEWTKDGNIAKTTTKYLNTESDSMVVEYEYQLDDNRDVVSYSYTQTDIKNGKVSSEKAYSVEHVYDKARNWRKRLHYKNGEMDHIYIQVSQQYLFEHPDATVPDELDFHPTSTAELYTIEELEAMAGDNDPATDDLSEDGVKEVSDDRGTEWKNSYIEYISDKESSTPGYQYLLIYVDNNDIPELYINGQYEAEGDRICTIGNNNKVEESVLSRLGGGSYIERSGMICNFNGNMDYYPLNFYQLKDGVFTELEDNGLKQNKWSIDKEDPTEIYSWNNEEISEAEFYNNWNDLMNLNELKHPWENSSNLYSASEIISIIQSLAEPMSATDHTSDTASLLEYGTYISNDGQTVCFNFTEMIVVITGYSEEGEYTLECPFYWIGNSTARRDIYNGIGEPVGYQDYIPSEEVDMTVETYNQDGVLIGSFLDGEFRFEQDE